MSSSAPTADSFFPALLRAYWMLLGNAAALVIALSIATHGRWSLGWRDVAYWLCVATILASRWFDVERYGGTTGSGDPMTRSMLARWIAGMLVALGVLWTGAQSIGL